MFLNCLLSKIQQIFAPIYNKSIILKNIDKLIGLNIFLVIFTSTFAQSDTIGYFALFAIMLTVVKLITKADEKFELSFADKFLLLYFIFVVISVAGSSLFYLSLKGFFKTLTYLGFYISVVNYLKDNKNTIKWIMLSFILCASYETFFAYLQHFGAVEEISGWQDMTRLNPEEVMTRVYGTLKPYNPNLFGGYMLSIIPAFIAIPTFSKKAYYKKIIMPLLSVIAILSIIALILTGCRGAYIGLFIQLVSLAIIIYCNLKEQLKKIFTFIISLLFIGISLVITSVTSLRARIFSIFAMRSDSSNSFRFNVYNSCIEMFKDNWLLGIGCGNQNFREIYGLYMKTGFDALSAYNVYLEIAVESGLFALIFFVAFLYTNFHNAILIIKKYLRDDNSFIVLSALISIVGMLTHGMVDTVFFRPQIQFTFWIMIGIIRHYE